MTLIAHIQEFLMLSLLVAGSTLELFGFKNWNYISCLLLAPAWILVHQNNLETLFPKTIILYLIWFSSSCLARLVRHSHQKDLKDLDLEIASKRENIQSINMSDLVIQEEINGLEENLFQTETLYEALKELNKTMEFSKTVEVFSRLITRLTSFEEGWLFMTTSEDSKHPPLSYHLLPHEPPITRKESSQNILKAHHLELLPLALRSPSILFIENPENDPRLTLKSIPLGAPSLVGMGLFHEGSPLGTLILEGCKRKELESLEILAIQLSMEIEKSKLYEKVKNLSIIDGLTQTYQRRHVVNLLKDELRRLGQQNKTCSILLADVDHFKSFNDNFGHLVGDILLKELSASIQENLRPMDLVGRFGGEEFLIALPETDSCEAFQIAERIRSDIQARNFVIHDKIFKLTLSIGFAIYPLQSKDLDTLTQMADEALYQAKSSGRNQVKICSRGS